MAFIEIYAGAATISTEFSLPSNSTTLSSITTKGIYQVFLDLSTLTSTESYTLKIKEKVQSTSTQRTVLTVVFSGVQSDPVYVMPAFCLFNGWDITLTKNQGTSRSIEWSVRQVG